MMFDDLVGGAVKVSRATVVAEAGPMTKHVVFRCLREHAHIRKLREKIVVVGNHGGDARLL